VEASPRPPAPVNGPIFIVSPMGTGSTLLRLILDSHPNIAIPHETGFMRIYTAMRFIPFKLSGRQWAQRLGWTDEELDEEARRFFERIFMRYAEQHGKQRWGEKTPQHLWHIAKMKRVFPDSVIVAIVRHPGAAAASNMRRFGHSARWAILHCRRYYKEIARQAAMGGDRMIVLRYEDLVLEPERLLRELLGWLGEPWDNSVLEHHSIQGERDHHRIEGLSKADEPITAARITKWAGELSEADERLIRTKLGRIAEYFGYSFDDPSVFSPMSETGSLLFGGQEADRRIEHFADIDIRTREEVPLPERFLHPRKVLIIPYPYERPRFIPGMPDVAAPPEAPPPGPVRRVLLAAAHRLPASAQRPLQALVKGRRHEQPRFTQPTPPELDEP
jgi:hypothetical protein